MTQPVVVRVALAMVVRSFVVIKEGSRSGGSSSGGGWCRGVHSDEEGPVAGPFLPQVPLTPPPALHVVRDQRDGNNSI